MSSVRKVLVVGGGVGGMSAAICLARGGIEVDLVEIKRDWNMLGAGLTFNSATLRSFDRIGVLDRISAEGVTQHDDQGGSGGTIGPLVGAILRPVLHAILTDAFVAAGARARTGLGVAALDQTDDAVDVTFSDGTRGRYDLVIGADGLTSTVRQMILPDAPVPQFTGQGCWRAVFPRPPGYRGEVFGRLRTAGLKPVSATEMYLFLLQAVPDNRRMPPERWPELLDGLMADFTDAPMVEARRTLGASSRIVYRPLEKLLVPPPWHRGRVVLIGDAVHATTPHMAYGAGLAVEDAIVLSDRLLGDRPLAAALDRYVAQRFERCRTVVEGSVAVGNFQLNPGPPEQLNGIREGVAAVIRQPI
jgi:2-polyprenyl-6-methoxyphenol hydroxylase-like FAD-dependent oxidoreductase